MIAELITTLPREGWLILAIVLFVLAIIFGITGELADRRRLKKVVDALTIGFCTLGGLALLIGALSY